MNPTKLGVSMSKEGASYQELHHEWESLTKLSGEIKVRKAEIRNLMAQFIGDKKPSPVLRNTERDNEMANLFKQGKTLQEIGDSYGFSREYVRQIIKRLGVTGEDGGASALTKKAKSTPCKVDGCEKLAASKRGYCGFHKARIYVYGSANPVFKTRKFQNHDGSCLVEGCDKPFSSNGLCNKHRTNLFINTREGKISDLNDFLNVQKARRMMGKAYGSLEIVREFMESNKEHFVEDLYKEV